MERGGIGLKPRSTISWADIRTNLAGRKSKPRPRLSLVENLVSPLVTYAWRRHASYEIAVSVSRTAEKAMRNALCRRLAYSVKSVVRFEWQLFLNVEQFASPTSNNKNDLWWGFFRNGVEETAISFGGLYPELRRIWVVQISNWLGFFQKFCEHSANFAHRLRFEHGARILGLHCDLSDPHRGNATVIRVYFAGGGTWFYKPRSAHQTKIWFNLLAQLNRRGFSTWFKIPRVLPARGHHWMEQIQGSPCTSAREEHDFWFRAGALLYLVYCLGGVDFHARNIICEGDQPIFVDCETLFHPETPLPREVRDREKGLFRTGMLPFENGGPDNVAGLGPMTVSRVSNRCFDSSAAFRSHATLEGFEAMHTFIRDKPNRLCDLLCAAGRRGPLRCRILYRPTAEYESLLQSSCHPSLLKNTARRSAFLRQACQRPSMSSIARREVAALRDLDIPFFMGRAPRLLKSLSTRDLKRATQCIARALGRTQKSLGAA
jgi:lantibiotic modifying enzyme